MSNPTLQSIKGWQRLRRNRMAMLSLVFMGGIILACFLLPLALSPARNETSPNNFSAPQSERSVTTEQRGEEQITYYWGADVNGRDLLSRVLQGGRVSLLVGFAGAAISLVIGTAVGLLAGYMGGRVDHFLMRTVDVLYAVPRLLFMLVIIATLDESFRNMLGGIRSWADLNKHTGIKAWIDSVIPYSRILLMILCLGFIEWLTMARIVRAQVLVLREQQFIAAAKALGRGPWAIMRRHLLPNLWTVILTYLTLTVPVVILDESFLSFLGLGIEEPVASWGTLLKEGAQAINPLENRWWLLVFPSVVMAITLLTLNFVGDGLRDAFDVK